jgi:hypothetical protein
MAPDTLGTPKGRRLRMNARCPLDQKHVDGRRVGGERQDQPFARPVATVQLNRIAEGARGVRPLYDGISILLATNFRID